MKPLRDVSVSILAGLKAVLTDIDDTLTAHGRLPPESYKAMHDLRAAGLIVVPITGRPAGWCDMIARQWPVDGVVGENGALYFRYLDGERKMLRVYSQPSEVRAANGARLMKIAARVLKQFPGTALASDQAYREIDVAIDFCEDVPPLPRRVAQQIVEVFESEGAVAKVSSIHVNAWFGEHDKLTMSRRMLMEQFGIDATKDRNAIAYCGDSPNDAPMFAHFPASFGVANIRPFVEMMPHLPAYVADAEGGVGFAEIAAAILTAKRRCS
jgi:HAD superfamily hydrolase (TIGR01484 family)